MTFGEKKKRSTRESDLQTLKKTKDLISIFVTIEKLIYSKIHIKERD